MSRARIGVDVGGSKLEAVALDPSGNELGRVRVPTPRAGYADTIEAIRGLVRRLRADVGCSDASVGVCMPGAPSLATGLIRNANSTQLNGRPFADDLSRALGRPVRIANDANCFALSEAVDGAGAGHRVVFGVILGTGVGAGIVVDRGVWTGRNAIAGEWGHNPLPAGDEPAARPVCYCGRRGCVETYLSGPALSADHARRTHAVLDARAIAQLAHGGDAQAGATMALFLDRLCRALAVVVNILDPDIVVLGGGLSNIDEIYEQVPVRLPPYVFSDSFTTPVVKNRHGDSSGVRGAAWLWPG